MRRQALGDEAAGYLLPDPTGVASAGERASPASSLFKYGKPNTPESSKLLGEQHLQTASGRAIIRAVGASILPDTGTYRVGQEKSPHGANMGLSGKVLYLRKKCYFNPTAGSVEAPLPSGYSRHHERAGYQMGQQHRGSSLPPADPTEGSLSTRAAGRLYPIPPGTTARTYERQAYIFPTRVYIKRKT